jgi:hypothetical protein
MKRVLALANGSLTPCETSRFELPKTHNGTDW